MSSNIQELTAMKRLQKKRKRALIPELQKARPENLQKYSRLCARASGYSWLDHKTRTQLRRVCQELMDARAGRERMELTKERYLADYFATFIMIAQDAMARDKDPTGTHRWGYGMASEPNRR